MVSTVNSWSREAGRADVGKGKCSDESGVATIPRDAVDRKLAFGYASR